MMELGEARDKYSEAMDKLAEAMSQMGAAIRGRILCIGEELLPIYKQWLEKVDRIVEWWKLKEQKQEEDRQKASELKLVSKRVVKLSKNKRTKVRKKNMARIRKELRLYEKRR